MTITLKVFLLLTVLIVVTGSAAADSPFLLTPQGARYQDLETGSGDSAAGGDTVSIHFTGWLDDKGAKGRQLFNSRRQGRAVSFVVGTDRVMPGWNEAVIGMRPGGKRLVMLPPSLAYGERGVQDHVPPGSSLIFVIELVNIVKSGH